MIQNIPIDIQGLSGNPLFQFNGQVKSPDYSEKLDRTYLDDVANSRIENSRRAMQREFMDSLPLMQALYSSGNSAEATAESMKLLNQMTTGRMASAEQDANINNEMTKRRNMAGLLDKYSQSNNPQNMGVYASMLKGIGGPDIDPNYMKMGYVSPEATLGAAIQAANSNAAREVAAAQMAQADRHHYDNLNARKAGANGSSVSLIGVGDSIKISDKYNELSKIGAAADPRTPSGYQTRMQVINELGMLYKTTVIYNDPVNSNAILNQIQYLMKDIPQKTR